MNKNTALWLMLGGAALSVYDLVTTPANGTGGALYGAGKPLENMRWKVHTTAEGKNWYLSVTDGAALAGAFFYFR